MSVREPDRIRAAVEGVGEFVTPLGRVVAGCVPVFWFAGQRLGWAELLYLSAAGLTVLLVGLAFTLGRLQLEVSAEVLPQRVVVGGTARAQASVLNPGSHRALPCTVELTVGAAVLQFAVPALAPGATHTELLEIPTSRRAVIPVGPARTLRQDPLGLVRRSLVWPQVVDLFVHPRTARVAGFGAGVLKDLEGQTTDATSNSDIELHALREYVPGDDRRFVHWRTSARRTDGTLMVRQFVDTRRSHVGVVLAARPQEYAADAELELGISVLASVALRGIAEQQDTTVLAFGRRLGTASGQGLLDATSGLAWEGSPPQALTDSVRQLTRLAPDVTVAVLITGSATTDDDLRAALARFPPDTRVIAVRCRPGAEPEFRPVAGLSRLTVGAVDDLSRLLWAVSRS